MRKKVNNNVDKNQLSFNFDAPTPVVTSPSAPTPPEQEDVKQDIQATQEPIQDTSTIIQEQKEIKNANNFHNERGKPLYDTYPSTRYKDNVKALQVLKQIQLEDRQATDEEKQILSRFSGWGGLGSFFQGRPGTTYWSRPGEKSPYEQIKEVLTEEEVDVAIKSLNSAFFTPINIVDSLWDVVQAVGFKGGKILEGSAGTGNILAQMPKEISDNSDIVTVEKDSVTGGILQLLYPDAQTHISGFEETAIANNSIDLAITNVPFGTETRVFDEKEKDLSKRFTNLHDFCIAKNVRKLKEGGLGVFITTKGTLDRSAALRKWLVTEGNADVVGAFRLHKDTFPGANVTSDIIVVKKRVDGKKSNMAIDVSDCPLAYEATYKDGYNKEMNLVMRYNTYFQQHPEMMGGQMQFNFERDITFHATSSALFNDGTQQARLSNFIEDLRMRGRGEEITPVVAQEEEQNIEFEKVQGRTGQITLNSKNEICTIMDGLAVPVTDINQQKIKGYSKQECVSDYIKLKKAVDDLLDMERKTDDDTKIAQPMQQLNEAYDTFVRKYGNLFKNTSLAWLRNNDVDFPSIVALENPILQVTEGNKKIYNITKTDIFTKRVIGLQTENKPQTIEDALIASIQQTSKISIPLIQSWLGGTEEQIKNDLLNNKLAFVNPKTSEIEPAYIYLSGNVREKLDYASSHNEYKEYSKNIEALKEVLPKTIPVAMINFSLGSTWLDERLYTSFIKEKFNEDVNVTNAGGLWYAKDIRFASEKNKTEGYYSNVCDKRITGLDIFLSAMNNQPVIVERKKKEKVITDEKGTRICCAKAEEYKEEFIRWARKKMVENKELGDVMEARYNTMFNSIVPLKLDERLYNSPIQGQNMNINLYKHQKEAIMRSTIAPTMLAHEVGTGKTYTLVGTAMRMKQLGVAKKPMIIVENSTIAQFTASAKQMFPNAKILSITDADRTPEGRRMFYAKIKYNDWDMIIIPHSVFSMIPDDPKREREFIEDKIDEAEYVYEIAKLNGQADNILKILQKNIRDAQQELTTWETGRKQGNKMEKTIRELKEAAKREDNAIARAKEMLDRKTDDIKSFDDLDIDALLVDEAHNFKRLGFNTALGRGTVKGVDASYSKRAQGLYLKIQSIFERTGHKNVVMATGTPISNTAAEIYTFMKYLYPAQTLRDNDIFYFDDFIHNFGSINTQLEFTTSGKYKEAVRFSAYNNMPELARFWNTITHTVLKEEAVTAKGKSLSESEIPELKGGKAQDIFLEPTKSFCVIMNAVRKKLEEYEQMSGHEKKENSYIPLVMYNIAARAAIDGRLINPLAADEPNSKTNETVRQTLQALEESKNYNGTVAIFCDKYQHINPNRVVDFNLYEDIKQKLIQGGIPEEQITIISSSMSDKKRSQVFDEVNAGTIRVVMGSTKTLGTGVNIQERLYTAIHVDCPARPMDMTQREGRILRQGNLHKQMDESVKILRMGVKESLDITGYQRLSTKAKFIHSVMNSKVYIENPYENRVLEDVETNYESIVAELSGSDNFMLLQELKRQKNRLETKKEQIEVAIKEKDTYNLDYNNKINYQKKLKETADKQLQVIQETIGENKPIQFKINGIVCNTDEQKKEAIKKIYQEISNFQAEIEKLPAWKVLAEQNKEITVEYNNLKFDITVSLRKVSKTREIDGVVKQYDTVIREVYVASNDLFIKKQIVQNTDFRNVLKSIEENTLSGNRSRELISNADSIIADMEQNIEDLKKQQYVFDEAQQAQLDGLKMQISDLEKVVGKEMKERNAKYEEAAAGATVDIDDIIRGEVEMQIIEEELNYDPEATYAVAEALNEAIGKENIHVISNDFALLQMNKDYNTELKTPTGTIYGFSNANGIYLTEYGINAETMIHEYTHLWMSAMEQHNPKGLQSVIDIFKGTPLWEKVIQDENYQNLKSDKEICSEVVARYSGKRGAERLEQEAKQIEKETKGKEKSKTIIQKAKEGLNTFWKFVGTKLFKIKKFTSQEQVADRILFDLLSATNLNLKQNQNDTIEFSIRNNLIVPNNKEDYNLLKEKNMTNNVVFPYEEFKYLGVDFSQLSNENLRLLTDGQPTEVLPLEVKYSEGMEKYCKDNDIEYHIEDDTIKFSGRVQLQKYIEVDNTPENKELLQINNINDYTERDNKLNISGDLAKVAQLTMVMMNPVIAFALFLIARRNKIATDNKMLTTEEINHLKEGGIVSKNKMIYQVDKQTNNIVSVSTNSVALPKNIAGQELTPMQKEQLLQGGTIQVKDLNISLDLYERGGLKAVNQKGEQIEFTIKDEKLDPKYLYDLHNANVFDSIPTDANRHEFMQYINEHLQKVEQQGPSTIEKLFPNDIQKQNAFLNHIGLEKEYEQWRGLEGKLDLSIEDKFKKNQIESRFKEAATNKLTQRLQQNESIKRVI